MAFILAWHSPFLSLIFFLVGNTMVGPCRTVCFVQIVWLKMFDSSQEINYMYIVFSVIRSSAMYSHVAYCNYFNNFE